MSLFLDAEKPLATCSSENCQDCPLKKDIVCQFNGAQLIRFFGAVFPVFIISGIGITRWNTWLLLPWIIIIVIYFGFAEIRVMCSHCPHYAEESSSLKCWANYGMPKLWKYRAGPMTPGEKFIFFLGLSFIILYPLVTVVLASQWYLLVFFFISLAGGIAVMAQTMCNHCMNFACPFNAVAPDVRRIFFERNPTVARAWQAAGKNIKE